MKIYRKRLITEHDPIFYTTEYESPLSVGNGNFVFTADCTGFQSFHSEFLEHGVPLCTMASWGWHTSPDEGKFYSPKDVELTEYTFNGRPVKYASERKKGNEKIYDWLRQNPHRLNLAVISLLFDGEVVSPDDVNNIQQHLHLYDGVLESSFTLCGAAVRVKTAVAPDKDILLFSVDCPETLRGRLSVRVMFGGGSPEISGWSKLPDFSASCTSISDSNCVSVDLEKESAVMLNRKLDKESFFTGIAVEKALSDRTYIKVGFAPENGSAKQGDLLMRYVNAPAQKLFENVEKYWNDFWEKGGIVSFEGSTDSRAHELERRIILSQYQQAINCTGKMPPPETGLFCNSWYGKFHLEMHFWHVAALPQWNHPELMERSFPWYLEHLEEARQNAAKNGYVGARWPKMTADTAIDSPSSIAVLLVWQQPHIIYMLEQLYNCRYCPINPEKYLENAQQPDENSRKEAVAFLEKYWILVKETADFMADFAVRNEKTGFYELLPPLIPVQEEYDPTTVRNPAFEISYWRFGLKVACEWATRLGLNVPEKWVAAADGMAPLPVTQASDGAKVAEPADGKEVAEVADAVSGESADGGVLYTSHENCPDLFTRFNKDHPSMLSCYSYFADDRVNPDIMRNTLKKVLSCWNFQTLWGWDFAAMAMTAVRLGLNELAVDLLLQDAPKNYYAQNGHNFQKTRTDLPAYLPGNGALLLAVAMMTAGYRGCVSKNGSCVGFPDNGKWHVTYEGISPLFS